MKTTILLSAAAAALISLSGCANDQQLGTGVGAVAGGAVGHALIGGAGGTIGGAAAGALIGNEVGRRSDYNRGY